MLFALSRDFVGDTSETIALMWPAPEVRPNFIPSISDVVTTLNTLGKAQLPAQIARWLDALDETGRWALLKLVMGALRVGVSARLAKTAAAALGDKDVTEIELMWSGLEPPYTDLFAWLEGRGDKPSTTDPAPFRPAMLAHAIEDADFEELDPADFMAEWKWEGIRVQASAGVNEHGDRIVRMYSRTGEDISKGFPDLLELAELQRLARWRTPDPARQPRAELQRAAAATESQGGDAEAAARISRASARLRSSVRRPAKTCVNCHSKNGASGCRPSSPAHAHPRLDLSPLVDFKSWPELAAHAPIRHPPAPARMPMPSKASCSKRRDAPYVPGRPKGLWWKWKRDPLTVDAVLMYAQRGSGKRSSYYSDYTFGVWSVIDGSEALVPVGKAYFGFTDEELLKIDKYVRNNTVERFGPVRAVKYGPNEGLVLKVAFEGLQRPTRHKSGLAMRFPRINRLRWDKPLREADRLETLENMLEGIETKSSVVRLAGGCAIG